jgi:hypothetical protein
MSESKGFYYTDRKGDQDVLTYGTLYKYDVPKYSKMTGFCVGLSSTMRLIHNEAHVMEPITDEKYMVCESGQIIVSLSDGDF